LRLKQTTLAAIVATLIVAAPPSLAQDKRVWTASIAGNGEATAAGYARRLADLINEYRRHNGLGPLAVANELESIATEHSSRMAAERRLSHDGFRNRFDRTSARICVENVGWNFPFPEAQLEGWRASPGHHRNLLEPKVARMGLAVTGPYVTFFACS
jgi:uncharacterized protein YkwD